MIISRDFLLWLPQLNSTYQIESIQHLFVISPKTQPFGVPNIHSIIMWPITWLFLFMLSIFPNQSGSIISTKLAVLY